MAGRLRHARQIEKAMVAPGTNDPATPSAAAHGAKSPGRAQKCQKYQVFTQYSTGEVPPVPPAIVGTVKFAIAAAVALAGFNLQATTIIALFNGEITSETITRDVHDGTDGSPNPVGTSTGMFSFTGQPGTQVGLLLGPFDAFCIEPREFVSPGSTYTYDFSDLAAGATNIGGMGVTKANFIRELFGRYYPVIGATLDAEHASALQIAIWEIVRETSGTFDVSNGSVVFSNPQDPAALNDAQAYLSSLTGTGPFAENLYALTAIGAQDVLVQVEIPEPVESFATGLALIALGLMAMARRRQRAS